MKGIITTVAATLMALIALSTATLAGEEPVLTVEILAADSGATTTQSYTMDQLRALPVSSFETETIWTEGMQTFTGVPLAALVSELDLTGDEIEAVAINAYSVKIPVSDAVENGPIIAFERNGSQMSIRNKGPLWIVYPYDSSADYRTEAIYSRSIWQLEKLVVKN